MLYASVFKISIININLNCDGKYFRCESETKEQITFKESESFLARKLLYYNNYSWVRVTIVTLYWSKVR